MWFKRKKHVWKLMVSNRLQVALPCHNMKFKQHSSFVLNSKMQLLVVFTYISLIPYGLFQVRNT